MYALILFQFLPSNHLAENPTAAEWYDIMSQITGLSSELSKLYMLLAFITRKEYCNKAPLHSLFHLCLCYPRGPDSALIKS